MATTWHYNEPEDGILRVRIEQATRPVNSLSRAALEELQDLVLDIRSSKDVKGVVFFSGKRGNFIAGADVSEFKNIDGPESARNLSSFGHKVYQQIEDLTVPTVALISGSCLGGGLEFTLACKYRIADDGAKTVLGFPEVKLGIIPGWGGTVRAPRAIGLTAALSLILTGRMLNARQAKSKGLVDDVVPHEALEFCGDKILRAEMKSTGSAAQFLPRRRRPLWRRIVFDNRFFYRIALSQAEKRVREMTRGHYPAPLLAVETIRTGLKHPEEGFAAEADALAILSLDPVARELLRLFFLSEEAKKPPADLDIDVDPATIRQAAVVGAGAMGAEIALLIAKRGIRTRLKDIKPEFVSRGMRTIRQLIRSDVKKRKITPLEATNTFDHLSPTTDYRGLNDVYIVIEAVLEDMELKKTVFNELAEATQPATVLATNTSSLSVTDLAKATPHPERVLGLHFFNPPHQMPLVEIVRTEQTSSQALARALALINRMGKTRVIVRDCAGFLVNRLLAPYMGEAGYLLTEVADPLEIERAAIDFGMPMGPLELIGLVGIEVAAHVAKNMQRAYGGRFAPAPIWARLEHLAASSEKGLKLVRKTRRGMRINPLVATAINELRSQPQRKNGSTLSEEVITQRLIFPIVNEATRCLDEGVVERPEDIDLAMVFGTGFAPFRGGPLRYADTIGVVNIVTALDRFAADHPRLAPCDELRRRVSEGVNFMKPIEEQLASSTL